MDNEKIELANMLINDLYLDLRRKVNYWSDITKQTPQAKMGYIGQHLVSIVSAVETKCSVCEYSERFFHKLWVSNT